MPRRVRVQRGGGRACARCGHTPANQPRGLCHRCWIDPETRAAAPPLGRQSELTIAGFARSANRSARPLPEPTLAPPGSSEKIKVLMAREEAGELLWHPQDATEEQEPRVTDVASKYTRGPWRVVRHDGEVWVAAGKSDGNEVLSPADQEDEEVLIANARLAALAPEMYELLAQMFQAVRSGGRLLVEPGGATFRALETVLNQLEE